MSSSAFFYSLSISGEGWGEGEDVLAKNNRGTVLKGLRKGGSETFPFLNEKGSLLPTTCRSDEEGETSDNSPQE